MGLNRGFTVFKTRKQCFLLKVRVKSSRGKNFIAFLFLFLLQLIKSSSGLEDLKETVLPSSSHHVLCITYVYS